MYELKTKPTDISPLDVIASIPHPQKQEDAGKLLEIFARATGRKPVVWGAKLIGYGTYRYQYPTGHRGEIYRLGKFTRGKSCLYINKLADVKLDVLEELIRAAWNLDPGI